MTTIIVTNEDNEIDEFGFDAHDQVISIGRRSSNDVCIPSLSVSGVHARITIDGDSALIEDNNSTNGTYINGRLISRQLLHPSDEIVIGKTRVTVQLSNTPVEEQLAEPPVLNAIDEDTPVKALAETPEDLDLDEPLEAANSEVAELNIDDQFDDFDNSFVGEPQQAHNEDHYDDRPMSLSEKAKVALGRDNPLPSSGLHAVTSGVAISSASAAANRAFANESDTAVAELEAPVARAKSVVQPIVSPDDHPLEGLEPQRVEEAADPMSESLALDGKVDTAAIKSNGAVIEIQNGAKSGQVLPIDKPVTTLGRPGIQIAAIMRKPDGFFLMHIESDDSVEMPTLNRDTIGDEPVKLNSGDRINVAGIDVEFMHS